MSGAPRHATTEELLAARDGEGSAWAKAHLGECRGCATALFELDQMRARLKALPAYAPPRDRWAGVAQVARAERRRHRVHGAIGLTAAAALTALAFAALRPPPVDDAAERAALERAMAESQALEQTLQALSPERRALPGDAARVVAELQARISRLDAQLGRPEVWSGATARQLDLWRERAGLMSALVDVHATRVAAAGL